VDTQSPSQFLAVNADEISAVIRLMRRECNQHSTIERDAVLQWIGFLENAVTVLPPPYPTPKEQP
jgi:hypothetical protein